MSFFLPLLLLLQLTPASLDEAGSLDTAVSDYWNLIQEGKQSEAGRFLLVPGQPFQRPIRSWRVLSAESGAGESIRVTVSLEVALPGGWYPAQFTDHWVFREGSWKIDTSSRRQSIRALYKRSKTPRPTPGTLEILPEKLKIHWLSLDQTGTLLLRNGLENSIRLVEITPNRSGFEILEAPKTIPPGEEGLIRVAYRGEAESLNLEGLLEITTASPHKETHKVQLYANYLSPGLRGLVGMKMSELRGLKKNRVNLPSPVKLMAAAPQPIELHADKTLKEEKR